MWSIVNMSKIPKIRSNRSSTYPIGSIRKKPLMTCSWSLSGIWFEELFSFWIYWLHRLFDLRVPVTRSFSGMKVSLPRVYYLCLVTTPVSSDYMVPEQKREGRYSPAPIHCDSWWLPRMPHQFEKIFAGTTYAFISAPKSRIHLTLCGTLKDWDAFSFVS